MDFPTTTPTSKLFNHLQGTGIKTYGTIHACNYYQLRASGSVELSQHVKNKRLLLFFPFIRIYCAGASWVNFRSFSFLTLCFLFHLNSSCPHTRFTSTVYHRFFSNSNKREKSPLQISC